MAYQSYTLKYRPKTFADIVGQEHVSRTLRNALAAGHVHHAYLFTGPRGTGKTTTARVLARALNCVHGPTPDPCGQCEACVAIGEGRAMDIIEIDAASNRGIDDIRELREKVKYSPAEHRSKLYILDEVHMLTTEAFNALLKTLEEPPPHAFFTLLTTEVHRVPPTILSRCQRFEFRPISLPGMVGALRTLAEAEGLQVTDEALAAVARAAEGAMRDAQSIFEQVVAFSEGMVDLAVVNQVLGVTEAQLLADIAGVIARRDLAGAFALVDQLVNQGKDLGRLMEDLTTFFRDLLRIALGSRAEAWLALGAGGEQQMEDLAASLGPERLLAVVQALGELRSQLKGSTQHVLLLELALVGLCASPVAETAPVAPRERPAAPPPQQARPPAPPAREAPAPAPVVTAPVEPPVAEDQAEPSPPAAAAETPEAAEPPVASGQLTCEAIWGHWAAVGNQLKRQGLMPVSAFLKVAMPTKLQGQRVTVSFPPTHSYHYNSVREKHAEAVQKALCEVFSCPLEVEFELCQSAAEMQIAAEAGAAAGDQAAPAPPVQAPSPAEVSPPAEPEAPEPVVMSEESPPLLEEPVSETDEPAEPRWADPLPEPEVPATPGPPPPPAALIAAGGLSAEEAVAQALTLFDGAQEVEPEKPTEQP
jgi:DNA polymerase-3 subunit gamma/tau